MLRGCPATGRMMHFFDKETHRCKCGRWERGFKPKTEPVRPRAECQICEREQATDLSGNLGHHGYTRPGCGYIQGDCLGVGHKPYPETDALVIYLEIVRAHIAKCKNKLEELPFLTEVSYVYYVRVAGKRENRTQVVRKGDTSRWDVALRQSFPGFDVVIRTKRFNLENEIRYAEADEKRVVARIAAAKPE